MIQHKQDLGEEGLEGWKHFVSYKIVQLSEEAKKLPPSRWTGLLKDYAELKLACDVNLHTRRLNDMQSSNYRIIIVCAVRNVDPSQIALGIDPDKTIPCNTKSGEVDSAVLVKVPQLIQDPQGVLRWTIPSIVWLKSFEDGVGHGRSVANHCPTIDIETGLSTDSPAEDGERDVTRIPGPPAPVSQLPRNMVENGSEIMNVITNSQGENRRRWLANVQTNGDDLLAGFRVIVAPPFIRFTCQEVDGVIVKLSKVATRPLETELDPVQRVHYSFTI